MSEASDFLATMLPRFIEVEDAFHGGDAGPRKAMWSHEDPVTLFGAAYMGSGWAELGPIFDRLATEFSNFSASEVEVVAADAKGDLAYLVAIEHTTASIRGGEPKPYQLRVTTIFRREDGEWKPVHRHADPVPQESG
ncbi:MAG TPA: nuclear transport factor 2 family protein [Actinomycetota bacterium]|nr:nuclear transport factor 2 family protein [Actinomycetota bacterium]